MPGRVIFWQGPALYFQQVTEMMGRCECAWSFSVPVRVIVGQGPALIVKHRWGRWGSGKVFGHCQCLGVL